MSPCCTPTGDFLESLRPSSRWVLLTRILFQTHHHLRQQTQDLLMLGGVLIDREAVDLIGCQGFHLPWVNVFFHTSLRRIEYVQTPSRRC